MNFPDLSSSDSIYKQLLRLSDKKRQSGDCKNQDSGSGLFSLLLLQNMQNMKHFFHADFVIAVDIGV